MIADLLDRRPPSPRYEESFLVAASFEPMSQRCTSWSQDSESSAFVESPAKSVSMMPTSARMSKESWDAPARAGGKAATTDSSVPKPAAQGKIGGKGSNEGRGVRREVE